VVADRQCLRLRVSKCVFKEEWWSVGRTVAMLIQPGSRSRASSKPPTTKRIRSVRKALVQFIVSRRMMAACGEYRMSLWRAVSEKDNSTKTGGVN
jgi:hypothetical protein